jgi:hypothetical protein
MLHDADDLFVYLFKSLTSSTLRLSFKTELRVRKCQVGLAARVAPQDQARGQ